MVNFSLTKPVVSSTFPPSEDSMKSLKSDNGKFLMNGSGNHFENGYHDGFNCGAGPMVGASYEKSF